MTNNIASVCMKAQERTAAEIRILAIVAVLAVNVLAMAMQIETWPSIAAPGIAIAYALALTVLGLAKHSEIESALAAHSQANVNLTRARLKNTDALVSLGLWLEAVFVGLSLALVAYLVI